MTKLQYQEYLKSGHWKRLRKLKIKSLGEPLQCEGCHVIFDPRGENYPGSPQVHHVTYERMPWHERLDDLVVLCEECHENEHDDVSCEPESDESEWDEPDDTEPPDW